MCDCCTDCLGRVPFASLIATLLCCIGVCVYSYTLHYGTRLMKEDVVDGLFHLQRVTSPIDVADAVFIAIGAVMGIFSIVLLVFGFLATGATRKNIYTGTKCIMGGRITAAFLMFMSYVFNLIWLLVVICLATLSTGMLIVDSWCNPDYERFDFNTDQAYACFRLSSYGIHINATELQFKYTDPEIRNELCTKGDIHVLCATVYSASKYYYIALGGSIMVVLGLVHYMIVNAANYRHILTAQELSEARQLLTLGTEKGLLVPSRNNLSMEELRTLNSKSP